jgi:hypothetical protein
MTTHFVRRGLTAGLVLALGLLASGCHALDGDSAGDGQPSSPSSAAAPAVAAFDSQFTRDGTFQSHIQLTGVPQLDFVYTLYPTKSTPRTNEWYPKGGKFFSFTFQAYDLAQPIRAKFATKRKVWLSHVTVSSATTTSNGGPTQQPYALDVEAPHATFDPQPLTSKYGMLITSPKGAFELRNQKIGTVSSDTVGLTLTMTASVSIETAPGSGTYVEQQVVQEVPIAIFASKKATAAQDIPVDAN